MTSWFEGTDEAFVDAAWRLAVRRPPEEEARASALERLRDGRTSRAALLGDLVRSGEFERVRLLDDGLAQAVAARQSPREVRGPARPRALTAPAGSDERGIEIPWCLARYDGERRVLDVGTANAVPAYVQGLLDLAAPALVTVDLVPPADVIADVRRLPFEAGRFDLALCISTLEHIGADNAVYGVEEAPDAGGHAAALRELHRVLADDGRLLLSVPTGERDDQGWQLQRPPLEWIELFERSGFVVFEDELYVRGTSGWRTATLAEAQAARYGGGGPGADAVLLAELRPGRLRERIMLAIRDARLPDEPRRSTAATPTADTVSPTAMAKNTTRSDT